MYRNLFVFLSFIASAATFVFPGSALGAGAGIVDNAQIFKPDTIAKGQAIIDQIKSREHHDVRVETFASIPENLKGQYSEANKQEFFANWAEQIRSSNSVTGVVFLVCMNPSHLQVAVGDATRRRAFTLQDRDQVRNELLAAFKDKNYDAGLLDALRTIQSRMTSNMAGAASSGAPVSSNSPSSGGAPIGVPAGRGGGTGLGGMFCMIVGAVIVLLFIVRMFNRNRGSGSGPGYGAPPAGGYPPGYVGGGYPPQGYGGGGGGGGFGRGLLGGLLGGAIGSWGYDKLSHPNQNQGGGYAPPPDTGNAGTNDVDTSSFSSGGDFGTPDSGSGGGDFGGGGDSGGGGGGDSGGGGDF